MQLGDVACADLFGERAARHGTRSPTAVAACSAARRESGSAVRCPNAGRLASRPRVYGCVGLRKMESTSPRSTVRPAYITCTRSAMRATTPRSWVMNTTPARNLCWMPLDHLEDLGLHGDVECRGRLVGDQHIGVVGDRHGDHHALAHATRELVRVLRGAGPRLRDADDVEQLDRAVPRRRLRHVAVAADHLGRPDDRSCASGSAPTADPGRSSRCACRVGARMCRVAHADQLLAVHLDRSLDLRRSWAAGPSPRGT